MLVKGVQVKFNKYAILTLQLVCITQLAYAG